ncbi:MAG: hypothetical protein PHN31_03885 [Candidatus Gracilibacteria bacterium]|nr:hypothetical protein [Candidatus Gracilibacteria bacterium]
MNNIPKYDEIKSNYINSTSFQILNTINIIKTQALNILDIPTISNKRKIINDIKMKIFESFGYDDNKISQIFPKKEQINELSSKNLYNLLTLLEEINNINNLIDNNPAEFFRKIKDFCIKLSESNINLLSYVLNYLEKSINSEFFEKIFYFFGMSHTDAEDFQFTNNYLTIESDNLNDEISKYLEIHNIDQKFNKIINTFISKILNTYGNNQPDKGYNIFVQGINILNQIENNKDKIEDFALNVKSYLEKTGKNKIYLNGRDGLKLKIILEKYLGKSIEIIWFECSRNVILNVNYNENGDKEFYKYLRKNGLNKNNISDFIAIDTGNEGRILQYINKIFGQEPTKNIFLWGEGENTDGYKSDYKIIEELPKTKQSAINIINGNIIQRSNSIEISILSDFSDGILNEI